MADSIIIMIIIMIIIIIISYNNDNPRAAAVLALKAAGFSGHEYFGLSKQRGLRLRLTTFRKSILILSKFYLQAKLQQTNTSNTHQYSPTWLGCGNTTGTRIAYGYIATTLQYASCMHFKLEDACESQRVQHGECGECMYEYKPI